MRYRPIILCYHRIAETTKTDLNKLAVPPLIFREQLSYLKGERKFVSLKEMVSEPNANTVAVTFDDGYKDNLSIAADILSDLDIPASFFLATRFIEHSVSYYTSSFNSLWTHYKHFGHIPPSVSGSNIERILLSRNSYFSALKKLSSFNPDRLWEATTLLHSAQNEIGGFDELEQPLNLNDVKSLLSSKIFSIGPHTATHPRMSAISLNDAILDFNESIEKTREWSDSNELYFPYPFGQKTDFSKDLEMELRHNFEIKGLSTFPSALNPDRMDRDTYPRLSVQNWEIMEFRRFLNFANFFSYIPIAGNIALKTSSIMNNIKHI